ncbi:hypothetical protein DH2020_009104 [Rehmannia glutinosa]|uniref:Potassium channel n=1 Tax=Rehmannia glutinosa TaxID=99300 RepID=A0ABR0X6L9_REHGL
MPFSCSKNFPSFFSTEEFDFLPSLGARFNRATKLRRHIISPFDPRYRAWDNFLLLLVIYSAWISPFEFAFLTCKRDALFVVDNVVNAFFAVDIVLTFFVAYVDNQSYLLIDDPKRIAIRSQWRTRLQIVEYATALASQTSQLPVRKVTLFAVHCAGCFNYMIAERYPNPNRTWIGAVYPNFKQMRLWDKYRDTIKAASQFSKRNQLPGNIQDQIMSHICLKFRTEGLKQQETLNELPKAIRSSIAHCLFYPLVRNVDLLHGVSKDFLLQLVPEMEAEYYPPREDVILQNEAPTDAYILVSGAVDFIAKINGHDQIIGKASTGEMFGEIGVLCEKPQPFGVRTTEVSQILRLNKTTFLNILRANAEDERIVMNNLFQKLKLWKCFDIEGQGDPRSEIDANLSVRQGHLEMVNILLEKEPNTSNSYETGRILPKVLAEHHKNESVYGLMLNHENEKKNLHSSSSSSKAIKSAKRVTIHANFQKEKVFQKQLAAKLIILPDTLEELLRIAGEKFGDDGVRKVVNAENAEIDDLSVIRDGEHLFLVSNMYEGIECEQ